MLRITIELLPGGSETGKKHLGTVDIWNDLTGDKSNGNYQFRLSRRGRPKSTWKAGELKGFPRKRLGAYDLLLRVLNAAVGERQTSASKRKHVEARPSPGTLKVKITSADRPTYWYADKIGQVFDVLKKPTAEGNYLLKEDVTNNDHRASVRVIPRRNCEVVNQ